MGEGFPQGGGPDSNSPSSRLLPGERDVLVAYKLDQLGMSLKELWLG